MSADSVEGWRKCFVASEVEVLGADGKTDWKWPGFKGCRNLYNLGKRKRRGAWRHRYFRTTPTNEYQNNQDNPLADSISRRHRSLRRAKHKKKIYIFNNRHNSHPNLIFLQYTIQMLVPHVMWSSQAVCDSKIDNTQCHLSALHGTRSA